MTLSPVTCKVNTLIQIKNKKRCGEKNVYQVFQNGLRNKFQHLNCVCLMTKLPCGKGSKRRSVHYVILKMKLTGLANLSYFSCATLQLRQVMANGIAEGVLGPLLKPLLCNT